MTNPEPQARTCKNGHPWTPENRRFRKDRPSSSCRRCENESRRVSDRKPNLGRTRRFCAQGHDKDTVGRDTHGRCSICSAASHRRSNLKNSQARKVRARIQAPDGWEDEFGPVPLRVSDRIWIDWVAVDRYLSGRPARDLTIGEHRALHLLEVMRRGHVSVLESAV